jgi:hypothetical protein
VAIQKSFALRATHQVLQPKEIEENGRLWRQLFQSVEQGAFGNVLETDIIRIKKQIGIF